MKNPGRMRSSQALGNLLKRLRDPGLVGAVQFCLAL